MKALSKDDLQAWAKFCNEAQDLFSKITEAHETATSARAAWLRRRGRMTSKPMQERSERWQETERGQAYQTWAEALRELADKIVDIETPEAPDEQEWLSEDPQTDPD